MTTKNPTVFLQTRDMALALKLVRLLNQHGINAFWVTEEEGRTLAEAWRVDGWMTDAIVAGQN